MGRPRRRRTVGELKKTPEGRAELERLLGPAARGIGRAVGRARIHLARRLYKETGSALYAWQAWRLVRAHGFDTPSWVAEYLDQGAERILRLAARPIDTAEDRPKLAARALSLFEPGKGRGSSLSRFALLERNLDGVAEMRAAVEGGASIPAAAREAAKRRGLNPRTWANAYRKLAPLLDLELVEL